jgi:hypothetical protein
MWKLIMKKTLIAFCLVSTLIMAGCSDGPSSSEISEAIQAKARAEVTQQLEMLQNTTGGRIASQMAKDYGLPSMPSPEDIVVSDLKILDMQESGNGDFLAKVKFTTLVGDLSEEKTARVSLTEVDSSWKAVSIESL